MYNVLETQKAQLSPQELLSFNLSVQPKLKNRSTALLLCLLLGGIGAHKFYLDKPGQGIVYLLFCWTFIPALIALIECFSIYNTVDTINQEIEAKELYTFTALRRT